MSLVDIFSSAPANCEDYIDVLIFIIKGQFSFEESLARLQGDSNMHISGPGFDLPTLVVR